MNDTEEKAIWMLIDKIGEILQRQENINFIIEKRIKELEDAINRICEID